VSIQQLQSVESVLQAYLSNFKSVHHRQLIQLTAFSKVARLVDQALSLKRLLSVTFEFSENEIHLLCHFSIHHQNGNAKANRRMKGIFRSQSPFNVTSPSGKTFPTTLEEGAGFQYSCTHGSFEGSWKIIDRMTATAHQSLGSLEITCKGGQYEVSLRGQEASHLLGASEISCGPLPQ
jgi:hypothetical protein